MTKPYISTQNMLAMYENTRKLNRKKVNKTAIIIIKKNIKEWMPEVSLDDFEKDFLNLIKDKKSEQGRVLNLIYDSVCSALDASAIKKQNHENTK